MSRKAFLTIDGLYSWDPQLFSGLQLPTQFASDPTIITDRLILDTMQLEVMYPDPDTFKKALQIFSKSRLHKWQKITDALYHVYDPFINFTRDETRTITETRDLEANRTDNLQSQETRNLAGSMTNTNQVAAWDNQASALTDREKNIGNSTDTGTDTISNTGTQKTTDEGTITREDIFHSEGDSALFTPTDVAKKEYELRALDDAISFIVNDIRDRFCLTVY